MKVCHTAKIVVVGVETFGWLALRALDLGPLELRRDRADDGLGDLILQLENIVERAFEALGPQMRPSGRIDQLPVMRTLCAALRTLPSST